MHAEQREGELAAADHDRRALGLEVVREATAVRRDVVAALVGRGPALDAERMLEEETELQRADPPDQRGRGRVRVRVRVRAGPPDQGGVVGVRGGSGHDKVGWQHAKGL